MACFPLILTDARAQAHASLACPAMFCLLHLLSVHGLVDVSQSSHFVKVLQNGRAHNVEEMLEALDDWDKSVILAKKEYAWLLKKYRHSSGLLLSYASFCDQVLPAAMPAPRYGPSNMPNGLAWILYLHAYSMVMRRH